MSIADRILKFRTSQGLTHQAFADAVGVSRGAVQQWEKGVTAPKRKNQPAVAAFMGITESELMALSLPDGVVRKEDGHYRIGSKPQTDMPAPDPGSASATGMEIAHLYDLIPITDRVRRVKAYNAATKAILHVLEEQQPTGPGDDGF